MLTYKRIKEFSSKHPQSRVSLSNWYKRMNKLKLESVNDVKKKFSGVDYIGYNRFVFNISGNKYRIVASIIFASRKVYIKFIGTHSEYSKINFRKS